jgi:hypothetical protein
MRRKKPGVVHWDDESPPGRGITLQDIEHFNARGMRRVYNRDDHFPGNPGFHMDVWKNRNGRLLARFWSHGANVDGCSYEILGIPTSRQPRIGHPNDESWVPQCLRNGYGNWILSEFSFTT